MRLLDGYGESGDWPVATWLAKNNPSLMIGYAGIGHHFLRLADASVPPLLVFDSAAAGTEDAGTRT